MSDVMRPQRLAIIDGRRTPFAKAGGRLKKVQADELAVPVLRDAVDRTGMPADEVDEVIMGCVCQPAHAANIARVIALRAGFPQRTPAMTVHRNCASGMEALTTAWERMRAGVIRSAVVGGSESMSNVPLQFGPEMTALFARLARAKTVGQRLGVIASFRPRMLKPVIALQLGLTDPVSGCNMGQTAENLANRFGISRDEQDAFALESHRRATAAQQGKAFADEILPWVDAAGCVHDDDGVRHDQTIEALEKLRPYFQRHTGTVTVGNACPVTDGACAMLVMPESEARERSLTPLGYLRSYAYAGCDPAQMGLGPVHALARLMRDTGVRLQDFDLIELNEAFAAQVLACERAMADADYCRTECGLDGPIGEMDRERLNIDGGAIAVGHPVGTTGARLVLTLLKKLQRENKNSGLATLCVGGGQGAALHLEVA